MKGVLSGTQTVEEAPKESMELPATLQRLIGKGGYRKAKVVHRGRGGGIGPSFDGVQEFGKLVLYSHSRLALISGLTLDNP